VRQEEERKARLLHQQEIAEMGNYQIKVEWRPQGETFTLDVVGTDTFTDLMQKIQDGKGINPDEHYLIFVQNNLFTFLHNRRQSTLVDLEIDEKSTLLLWKVRSGGSGGSG
jgi:hypothetical protein